MKIPFRPITLDDKETITRYTLSDGYRNCDFAFANMCSWQYLYGSEYAVVDDTLLIRFYLDDGRPAYMMPQGALPLTESIALLIADAASLGHTLCLLGVSEKARMWLQEAFPERFHFVAERSYYDYIYLRTDLAALTGKRFQPKRNHINRFIKENPDYRYEPLTAELVPVCLRFEEQWFAANSDGDAESLDEERKAMIFALHHFEELALAGGTLWAGDRLVAFTYGSPITNDTFGVHVEKADAAVEGAYAMINREFAARIPEQYRYVNREEDLGLAGLRQAKLSYQPFRLYKKMAAFYSHRQELSAAPLSLSGSGAEMSAAGYVVRFAQDEDDRRRVMDLWQTCFHDRSDFLELFFSRKYTPHNTRVAMRGDTLCSALQHLPYMMSLWNGEQPLSYFAGLSTAPQERGRGLMSHLIRESFYTLHRRNIPLAALIPAEESLYGYYRRFGFETVFYREERVYRCEGDAAVGGDAGTVPDDDTLYETWQRLTAARRCTVLHLHDDFAVVLADVRNAGGDAVCVCDADGCPSAMAWAVPADSTVRVLDLAAVDSAAFAALLQMLYRRYGCCRLSVACPPETPDVEPVHFADGGTPVPESKTLVPTGMARVVDAVALLDAYAESYPNRSLSIRLSDDMIPENTGIYIMKEGCSQKQPSSDMAVDYDFDMPAFTRWIFTEAAGTKPFLSLMFNE